MDKAGKTAKCPACGITLQIPTTPSRQDDAPPRNLPQHVPQGATGQMAGTVRRLFRPLRSKINFACSGCGKAIIAPADRAGKTGKCPACGVAIQIPQTPDYYKGDLMAACTAIGKAADLRGGGESRTRQ